jgi:hypothetical protein
MNGFANSYTNLEKSNKFHRQHILLLKYHGKILQASLLFDTSKDNYMVNQVYF